MSRRNFLVLHGLLIFGALLVFGSLSLWLGQDMNWDLRNYHFYNAYSFLYNRMGFDIAPAFRQTYLNPLADIPFYLMVTHWPPKLTGFIMGALHGLNFWLLVLIGREILGKNSGWKDWNWAILAAAVGMLGPSMILELGTTFNDALMCLFVLGALLLFLKAAAGNSRTRLIFLGSGIIMGLAVGLKQTTASYGLGLVLASFFVPASWKRKCQAGVILGLGEIAGFLTSSGFWMLKLWNMFGNPFFPFWNNVFKSPYTFPIKFIGDMFFPETLKKKLFFPFYFAADYRQASNVQDSSWWLAAVYVLLVISLVAFLMRKKRAMRESAPKTPVIPWLVFIIVSYLAWQIMFSYYRYVMTLELLCPLVVLVLLRYLMGRRWAGPAGIVGLLIMLLVPFDRHTPDRVEWTDRWFEVELPSIQDPDHAMVLLPDETAPVGYLIPLFPPGIRFIRINGEELYDSDDHTMMNQVINRIVSEHEGPLYAIWGVRWPDTWRGVRDHGLTLIPASERLILTKGGRKLVFGKLRRIKSP